MGRDLHKRKVPFMEINEKDSAEMRYGQIWFLWRILIILRILRGVEFLIFFYSSLKALFLKQADMRQNKCTF